MKHTYLLWFPAMLAVAGIAGAQTRPAPIRIHSVHVDLPASQDGFPPGPGSELAGKCLICHSAGMVLKQPLLSEAQWKAEVDKMRSAYGAPIAAAEVDTLAAYLVKVNAAQQSR